MKKILALFFSIASLFSSALSQITFEKSYKKLQQEEAAQSAVEDGTGGYVVATGGKYQSTGLIREFGLTHLNAYGDTIWYSVYSMDYHPMVREVRKSANAYYVIGQADDTAQINTYMLWLNKFDLNGNLLWSKYLSDPDIACDNFGLSFSIFGNGNLFISNGLSGFYLIDSLGNFLSLKNYFNYYYSSNGFMKRNILQDSSNNLLFLKYFTTTFPLNLQPKILKLNQNGDTLSSFKAILDSSWGNAAIISILNNGYLIIGNSSNSQTNQDYYITKIDSNGIPVWRRIIYGKSASLDFISGYKMSISNRIVFAGFPNIGGVNSTPKSKAFLYCFNDNGDSLWYKEFSPTDSSLKTEFYDVIATSDSGLLACGQLLRSNGTRESYIVKLDASGNLYNPLSVVEKNQESYLHLYPNPAQDKVSVHFMGAAEQAVLRICTIDGREVYRHQFQGSSSTYSGYGDLRKNLLLDEFEPGLYFCSIYSNGKIIKTEKLVKLR